MNVRSNALRREGSICMQPNRMHASAGADCGPVWASSSFKESLLLRKSRQHHDSAITKHEELLVDEDEGGKEEEYRRHAELACGSHWHHVGYNAGNAHRAGLADVLPLDTVHARAEQASGSQAGASGLRQVCHSVGMKRCQGLFYSC